MIVEVPLFRSDASGEEGEVQLTIECRVTGLVIPASRLGPVEWPEIEEVKWSIWDGQNPSREINPQTDLTPLERELAAKKIDSEFQDLMYGLGRYELCDDYDWQE